jgi:hypothetical protein
MTRLRKGRPSPTLLVAVAALIAALGGTAVASDPVATTAISKKKTKKIAKKQAKKYFDANIGDASVANAKNADTAETANAAFSTFHNDPIAFPNSLGTIGTLNIPKAGSYVVNAKLWSGNLSATNSNSNRCTLTADADSDTTAFDNLGNATDDSESVALQVVHTFDAPGSVVLACTDTGLGDTQAFDTKITAVQVADLTNTGF